MKKGDNMQKRACGVLLPVFSLPSEYGIGAFSKEAYSFVDFLKKAGQKYWQILPLGPTGYGDSPYQSFSTFAGNPYLIDPEYFVEKGLLTRDDLEVLKSDAPSDKVDYKTVEAHKYELIRKAFLEEIPDTTKIIIAQRISSVQDADKIIVMYKGRIDAVGTHEELLKNNKIYSEVYYSQQKGSEDNG